MMNRTLVQQAWHMAVESVLSEPYQIDEYLPDMGAWMIRLIGQDASTGDIDWGTTVTVLECLGYTLDNGVVHPID